MAFPPFNRRGHVNTHNDPEDQQVDSGGVSDGRDPRSLKGLGRARPGSQAIPRTGEEADGNVDNVSGLDQIGSGSYSGPAMAVTSYTSNGVYTGQHSKSEVDDKDPDGWGGGYARDDPQVLSKIFGVRGI